MLCVYDNLDKNILSLLKKTKENYNLNNKTIAQKIESTEAAVSRWFAGKSKPNKKSCEKIIQLFHEIWEPGIIELPPCSHWRGNYYLRVEDLRNPFDTWHDGDFTGEYPESFLHFIEEWEEKGQFRIVKRYEDYKEFKIFSALEEQNCNTTSEFLYSLPAQQVVNLIQDGKLNASAFDYQLLGEAVRAQNERG
jgi:DNA-binding XRE family transcriptional regulator